jgi:asparagine synthase (glutamine-hydrolysing)
MRIATEMRDTLTHRGPDDFGVWVDPEGTCALAHRRLSIIDLSDKGRQPMVTPDGAVGLVFNGEIYNFREHRSSLEKRGYTFNSNTDSEVLLHLFSSANPSGFSALEGMYAFAVFNSSTRRLLLARDPFGKKPLYVAHGDGWMAFASELQAFSQIPGFEPQISPEGLAEYLLLQYVHAPRTILRDCEKIPPGSWSLIDFAGGSPRAESGVHFRFRAADGHITASPYKAPPPAALEAAADELRPVILDAVSRRLISDVPLGAFLSGGIDSAIVVAMMRRELGIPVETFSIGFEGTPESEHLFAREASRLLDTQHHEKILDPKVVDLLPRIAGALDEPLGDSSCLPTYLLSEFTREHVTVSLSGDGGDELFGGYGRYRETLAEEDDWRRRARYLFRERKPWRPAEAYCSARWLMFTPESVRDLAGPAAGDHASSLIEAWRPELSQPTKPLIHRMREIDTHSYLPGAVLAKVDRMSMAFALEVRCPLLDSGVAEAASKLGAEFAFHSGVTKPLLRALAGRYMPSEYIQRPKMGFGLPGKAWTQQEMLELGDTLLLSDDSQVANFLNPAGVRRFVDHQRQEGCFSIFQTWTMLMLEAWLRAHLGSGAAA